MNSVIINVKGEGRLSAETIVTVRALVTYHLDDEPHPTLFEVMITAPAVDLELFFIALYPQRESRFRNRDPQHYPARYW